MKELIRKSLLFLLFFLLVFTLVNIIYLGLLVFTDEGFKKRIESLNFENPDFKLLVMGTSFAEYGVDTELLTERGIKSFNFALAGNSYETSYIQLDEYLIKYKKRPDYVLLFINSYRETGESDIIEPIVEFTMESYEYGLKDIPIFRFTWLGTEMIKKILSSKHRKARLSYGQVKFEKNTADNTQHCEIYLNIQDIESKHWIGEMARLCDQKGIKLIIVEIPGFRETQNLSGIGPYDLYLRNGYSVPLYNFNSQAFCTVFDPKKDWVGNSHLNSRGAEKFTGELIKVLNLNDIN